ncbi:hypothetical protein LTR78_000949 [Recurvomyces mirabilis]|uniref:Seipin n=1 Tax=Recurvomyces mirabilis TaxID=574656 RepID=A0AAE1C5Z8_9PEZI|nr:hypothetical protein LTR78_000949 [Recurvomyces mirabilis]KAK5158921.1 hypothetical protein LTS14_003029 [Recurvomyces mirabilis]
MPPKSPVDDDEERSRGLIGLVQSLVLKPFRIALSRTALRAYLTTIIVVTTAITLLGFAISAYLLFYWSYVPRIGFERPINLQFDIVHGPSIGNSEVAKNYHPYPYGIVNLYPDIFGAQIYDVAIELTLPRTPENVNAGNFMLEVSMLAPREGAFSSIAEKVQAGMTSGTTEPGVLATSRRSAILQYRSPIIELVYKLTEIHWYLLNVRSESDKLRVLIFEGVEFSRGARNVPRTMRLEIQSTERLRVYDAKAVFRARFHGLRWLMYNHRIISGVLFIGGFWTTEMIFAGLAWALIAMSYAPTTQETKAEELDELAQRVKDEPDDESHTPQMSDTERTFPTLSGQQPLRYQPEPRIKLEHGERPAIVPEYVSRATEADVEDEDEDADFLLDSGLGTSLESSGPRRADSIKRRRGRTRPYEEE